MSFSLVAGALICVLLGVFIFFTSMSVKKFLSANLNALLEQHHPIITSTPFECEGLFKISCNLKELSLSKNSPFVDFKNLSVKINSLDKSSLALSIKSQIKSPILEQLVNQKAAQMPLKDLNSLFEKAKPTHLNCSLQFNALDEKTLNNDLKCHLTNPQNILTYTFSQKGIMITQDNLSFKHILKTLTSKDTQAIEKLQESMRFLISQWGFSIQAHHLKSLLEPFYNENKGIFHTSYDTTLDFLEETSTTHLDFKDNVFQKSLKEFLNAFKAMAKNERSEIMLNAQVKDTTKLSFNAMLESLKENLFNAYEFSVK
ncbi:hypothetical protein HCD_05145 [Helicobacter cetorum MIT 99-5656]|uniref:Uncharacterized protein n=2 Tax=Helicobacter cetorum TaxID=138563 RepID=I0ESW2_HELCM|nr:hypothetical protein HCD_05145 [Helicobacter cetorum MIT 99-5656]